MEGGSLECFSASSDRDFLVAMGGLNFRPLFQFSISHFENDPSDFRMNRALLMIYNSTGIIGPILASSIDLCLKVFFNPISFLFKNEVEFVLLVQIQIVMIVNNNNNIKRIYLYFSRKIITLELQKKKRNYISFQS